MRKGFLLRLADFLKAMFMGYSEEGGQPWIGITDYYNEFSRDVKALADFFQPFMALVGKGDVGLEVGRNCGCDKSD